MFYIQTKYTDERTDIIKLRQTFYIQSTLTHNVNRVCFYCWFCSVCLLLLLLLLLLLYLSQVHIVGDLLFTCFCLYCCIIIIIVVFIVVSWTLQVRFFFCRHCYSFWSLTQDGFLSSFVCVQKQNKK